MLPWDTQLQLIVQAFLATKGMPLYTNMESTAYFFYFNFCILIHSFLSSFYILHFLPISMYLTPPPPYSQADVTPQIITQQPNVAATRNLHFLDLKATCIDSDA